MLKQISANLDMQSVAALPRAQALTALQHARRYGLSMPSFVMPGGAAALGEESSAWASVASSQIRPRVPVLAAMSCCQFASVHGRPVGLRSVALFGSRQTAQIRKGRQRRFDVEWLRARRTLLCQQTAASSKSMATLAEEGRSSSEGVLEEARPLVEEHADASRTEEDPVVIRVRGKA